MIRGSRKPTVPAIVNAVHLRDQVLMMETETEVEPKDLLSSSSQITGVARNAALGAHVIKELSKFEEAQNAKKGQQRSHAIPKYGVRSMIQTKYRTA